MTRLSTVPRGNGTAEFRTEGDFQRKVIEIAQENGWGISGAADKKRDEELAGYGQPPAPLDGLVFHPRIMYRTEPGWPDLTLIRLRDRRIVWAELKLDTKASKPSPRQWKVLRLLEGLAWPRCTCNGPLGGNTFGAQATPDGKLHDSGCALIGGAFSGMATRIETFIWRPSNLPEIYRVLA